MALKFSLMYFNLIDIPTNWQLNNDIKKLTLATLTKLNKTSYRYIPEFSLNTAIAGSLSKKTKILNGCRIAYKLTAAQSNNFIKLFNVYSEFTHTNTSYRQNKQDLFSTLYFFSNLGTSASSKIFFKV